MQPSYFISYAHQDREVVEKIRSGIQKGPQRFHVWFDESNLEPGCRIDSAIEKAIDMCSAMLFVATKNSVQSAYCLDEISRGRDKKKTIVPLRLDPDVELPFRLGSVHYIDFSANFEDGLKELHSFLTRERREVLPPPDTTMECRDLANMAIGKQESGDLVGTTLYCMAALKSARQTGDKTWEARIWNIIGDLLGSVGQISAARQATQRALELSHNLQREIEVVALANLGQHYEGLDHSDQAQQVCDRACRIAQVIGYQLGESIARRNLGIFNASRGKCQLASEDLTEAARLADATKSVQLQQTTRIELATALLLCGKLGIAEVTIDGALRYDTPLFSPEAHALRGVIRQRQGNMRAAAGSFYDALDKAQEVLKQTPRYYRVLDVMGLSYCGLMCAEETNDYLDEAVEAYQASYHIANAPGIVRRRLLLFDALAHADSGGKLASVRKAIDPEH